MVSLLVLINVVTIIDIVDSYGFSLSLSNRLGFGYCCVLEQKALGSAGYI
jgi:hypothetical protein